MKRRTTLLIVLLLLTQVLPAAARSERDLQREIDAVRESMRAAIQRDDAEGSLLHYADDAIFYPVLRPLVDTPEENLKQMRYALDIGLHDFRVVTEELIGDGEDYVVEIGRCTFYNGLGETLNTVRFMTVWKRIDGRLKVWRDISN